MSDLISKYTINNEIVEHIGNMGGMMVLRRYISNSEYEELAVTIDLIR